MAYQKQEWSLTTPITPERLNHIEDGFTELDKELYFQPGETLNILATPMMGYITSAQKMIRVIYTFPKSIKDVNIEITSFEAEMRGNQGYINASGYQNLMTKDYVIEIDKIDDRNGRITITKASDFKYVDNNVGVILNAAITFKFS